MATFITRIQVIGLTEADEDAKALIKTIKSLRMELAGVGKDSAKFKELTASINQANASLTVLLETSKAVRAELSAIGADIPNIPNAPTVAPEPKVSKSRIVPDPGSIAESKKQLADLRKQLELTAQTLDGKVNPAYETLLNQYTEVQTKVKGQQTAFKAQAQSQEVAAGSIIAMRLQLKNLNAELDNTPVLINGQVNPAFAKMARESNELTGQLKAAEGASGRFQRNVGNYPTIGQNITTQFKQVGASLLSAFSVGAVIQQTGAAIKSIVNTGKEFTSSISQLASITGASGKDLQFLGDEALRLSETVEGGAPKVVEAFKLIGSAKPELLADAQALSQVTEAAILLADASGLKVPEAATALTTALNQFSLPASEAAAIVNQLAIASQAGATEIPDVVASLEKFGSAASAFGVKSSVAIAAVETLGEKSLKAEVAGTALRNIFITLGQKQIGFKDGVLDLNAALTELAPIQKDVTKLTELFGKEGVIAAQSLIGSRDRFKELSVAIAQDTAIAAQQARTNNDNLAGDLKRLDNTISNIEIGIFQEFSGDIRGATQGLTEFLKFLGEGLKQGLSSLLAPFKGVTEGFASFGKSIASFVGLFGKAGKEANVFGLILKGVGVSISFITKPIEFAFKAIGFFIDGFTKAGQAIKDFVSSSPNLMAAFEAIGNVIGTVTGAVKDFGSFLFKYSGAGLIAGLFTGVDDARNNAQKLIAVFGSVENAATALAAKFSASKQDVEDFGKVFDKGLLDGKAFGEASQIVQSEFAKFLADRKASAEQANSELAEIEAQAAADREAKAKEASDNAKRRAEEEKALREKIAADIEANYTKLGDLQNQLAASNAERIKNDTQRAIAEEELRYAGRLQAILDGSAAILAQENATDAQRLQAQQIADKLIENETSKHEEELFGIQKAAGEKQVAEEKAQQAQRLGIQSDVLSIELSTIDAQIELAGKSLEKKRALFEQEKALRLELLKVEERVALEGLTFEEVALGKREALVQSFAAKRLQIVKDSDDELLALTKEKGSVLSQVLGVSDEEIGQFKAVFEDIAAFALENIEQGFEARKKLIDEALKQTDERIAATSQLIEEQAAKVESLEAQLATATGDRRQRLIQQLERAREAEKALAATQAAGEKRKQELLQQTAEIEAKQAKIRKAQAMAQVVVNTAVGISRTIADVPKADFGISTGILIALYAALGAAQLAAIAAQKFERGGLLNEGGILQGPSHAQGGIPISIPSQGRVVEAEGREAIINALATDRNRDALMAINADRGKNKFDIVPRRGFFADGGLLAPVNTSAILNSLEGNKAVALLAQLVQSNSVIASKDFAPTIDVRQLTDTQRMQQQLAQATQAG